MLEDEEEPSNFSLSYVSTNSIHTQHPHPDNIRLINRQNHHFNVKRKGISSFRIRAWYHSILDYSWYKFLVILTLAFVVINFIFGALYFVDPSGIEGVRIRFFYVVIYLFYRLDTRETCKTFSCAIVFPHRRLLQLDTES